MASKALSALALNLTGKSGSVMPLNLPLLRLVILGAIVLILMGVSAYFTHQMSGSALLLLLITACSCVILFYREYRNSTQWQRMEQRGSQCMLQLYEQDKTANAPAAIAQWLAFHRLGRLAWLQLRLKSPDNRRFTLFLWQTALNLQAENGSVKDWSRRWHTLQCMKEDNKGYDSSKEVQAN